MTRHITAHPDYEDRLEYHGSTTIERVRRQAGITIRRDWLMFNTVEEACEYFNEHCDN